MTYIPEWMLMLVLNYLNKNSRSTNINVDGEKMAWKYIDRFLDWIIVSIITRH